MHDLSRAGPSSAFLLLSTNEYWSIGELAPGAAEAKARDAAVAAKTAEKEKEE